MSPNALAVAADLPPPPAIRPDGGGVQRIDPLEDAGWDARLTAVPSSSFFHGAAWARVLRETYGFQPVYFTLSHHPANSGASLLPNAKPASPASLPRHHPLEFHALLPVMEVNSWLTGRRGVSLPFTDECAPLCTDADSFGRLFREVLEYSRARAWNFWSAGVASRGSAMRRLRPPFMATNSIWMPVKPRCGPGSAARCAGRFERRSKAA